MTQVIAFSEITGDPEIDRISGIRPHLRVIECNVLELLRPWTRAGENRSGVLSSGQRQVDRNVSLRKAAQLLTQATCDFLNQVWNFVCPDTLKTNPWIVP